MALPALLFDSDGLIIDTESAVYEGWREFYASHGHHLAIHTWAQCVGTDSGGYNPKAELEALTGKTFDWVTVEAEIEARIRELLQGYDARPGVPELLDEAAAAGVPCSAASGSHLSWLTGWLRGPSKGPSWFFSFWPLQIGGWGLNFLVPALFLSAGSLIDPSSLCYAITRPLDGFLITLALRPCCSWVWARFGKHWLLVPGIILVSLLLSYLDLMWIDRLVLAYGLPGITRQFWIAIFFMRAATFTIWLLLYFGIKSIKHHAGIEREFQQSELKLLRSQVNPHFLFNALATIMAVRKDEALVSQVTQSLADYLRFSLAQESQDQFKHPLGQEVTALENYLLVEKIRFQEKLETRIEVSEEAYAAHAPTALIQPLLENAIKYGQQTSPPPLCIAIEARLSEGRLLLLVENTGRWVEPHGSESIGLGIANLRKRLHLLYGDQAELTLDRTATAVRAQVSLPVSRTI